MKAYDVNGSEVQEGIQVADNPYPHIVLGEGGHKRATWVPLGNRDAGRIVEEGKIVDVDIIVLRDKETNEPTGKYLIVKSRNVNDNRMLILWRVKSGYRGGSSIEPGDGVIVIASDNSWHSGRGNLGITAETLAVLKPGQELKASISGRRVQNTRAILKYDGESIAVTFGGDELESAISEHVDGEYL